MVRRWDPFLLSRARIRRVKRIPKATAVLVRQSLTEEVLVIEHPLDEGGSMLQLPAGTVESNEEPEVAVLRELTEETGVVGELRALAGVLDEEYAGEARRRWIYLMDAPEGLPDEWPFTCDCGASIRCFWLPFETATLVESQRAWIDLARSAVR